MVVGDAAKAQKRLAYFIAASEKQLQKFEVLVKQLDPAEHDEIYINKKLSMLEITMNNCQGYVEELLELLLDDKMSRLSP
jgi:hypothetical protein